MESIKRTFALRLPAFRKLRRTPLLESAVAFAALTFGGWGALWVMELLFRSLGVA